MKRTVICAALLAAMIITGTVLSVHTENMTAQTAERLVRLDEMSHTAGRAELVSAAEAISADWEAFCANNIFLTNNECAFEISEALLHIIAELRCGETDIAEECAVTVMLLDVYEKSRALTLENIF